MSKNKSKKNPEFIQPKPTEVKPKFIFKKWQKTTLAVFFVLAVLPAGTIFAFENNFSNKIYPGIRVGELNLGGKTKEEAMTMLNQVTSPYNDNGIGFIYQNKKASVLPVVTAAVDPDLSRTAFSIDNKKTVEGAMAIGRSDDFWNNLKNQLKLSFSGQDLKLEYQLNEEEITKVLRENFGSFETPAKKTELKIVIEPSLTIEVGREQDGQVFDYSSAIAEAFDKVSKLDKTPTPLNLVAEKAEIKEGDTLLAQEKAKKLANFCSITLGEAKKTWIINQSQIRDWLEFQMDQGGVTVGLNKDEVEQYLNNLIPEINVSPQDANLTIENGKVKEFQIHQGGKELNVEASYNKINDYIINFDETKIPTACPRNPAPDEKETIQLIVKITAPQIPIGSINNLGIQELVGVGESNFAGSPVNRRHNIATGAAKLNGVLIAPGEEFSTNKALGEINGATGYLPELVIKGDKTIPEYGGGLCQIGTTMFRVALNAGLPITERRPHSYRVVYYEPAGMDATIYSPKPDLKFINDTPAYLLLQTKIDGDNLTFELWGTPDGRQVEITTPKVYNFVSPGPTKIVETEDLAPGVKKCTERAHTGADAEFSRTVTSKDGEIKTETWTSHYVPWSAVCLVGKEPAPAPVEPPPSESTPPPASADPALLQPTF